MIQPADHSGTDQTPVIGERFSSLAMLVMLGILVFVYNLGVGIYYAVGLEPSPTFDFLYTAAFLCICVWWLRADARRYTVKQVYCLGLLVGMGWMIMIPHHLFKTRGVRGFIPLLALMGSFLVAQILTVMIYLFFSANLRPL